jgi:hypothetical protein
MKAWKLFLATVKTILKLKLFKVNVILSTNEELQKDLKKEFEKNPFSANFGLIFKNMAPFLKVYTQYISNFDLASQEVERLENQNKKFSEFLETCYESPECENGQRLLAFLVSPVQRIPRYQLLFRVRIKLTQIQRIFLKELQRNICITKTPKKDLMQL